MHALSEAWQAGVVVLDSSGHPDFATRKACELLLVNDLDDLQAKWATLSGPIERIRARASATDGQPFEIFLEVQGTARLFCQLYAISEEDCVGHLLTVQSADRVARLERSLRQSTRHRGLVSLYRDMAHDIKGSLNALALNVEVLSRTGDVLDGDARLRSAFSIRAEIDRLDRVMASLLDRSVLEGAAGRRVDVKTLVDSLAELIRGRCRTQHVKLETDVADEPLVVNGLPDQLHSALLNLCVNALDAMPHGGILGVVATRVGSEIQVTVSDTGSGVAPEDRAAIWRLYYSTKAEGTGVGLHVVRAIARAHEGRAELVEPDSRFRTSFRLVLPAAAADA
jgi:signal transduction histidine kinase